MTHSCKRHDLFTYVNMCDLIHSDVYLTHSYMWPNAFTYQVCVQGHCGISKNVNPFIHVTTLISFM